MLALWFRQLYPDLTVGAIGSSAPVEAVVNFTSEWAVICVFFEYLKLILYNKIKKSTRQLFLQLRYLLLSGFGKIHQESDQ